jgi:hypothetical protein
MATVAKPAIKYVDEKDGDVIIGCDPVAVISLVSEDGNPHELADALGALRGKRVRVQITLEQPELFSEDETVPSAAMVEDQR